MDSVESNNQSTPQKNNKKIEDCDISSHTITFLLGLGIEDTDQLAAHFDAIKHDAGMSKRTGQEIMRLLAKLGYIKVKSSSDDVVLSDEELEKKWEELFVDLTSNDDGSSSNDEPHPNEDKSNNGEESDDEEIRYVEYEDKIVDLADFPEYIRKAIHKELNDFQSMSGSEEGKIRRYLDWVFNVPWVKDKIPDIDIEQAKNILDKHHYGLQEVKERILEFMAVQKLTGDTYGTVLLLTGPPGVGKTSIAKSIAEAMQRKFVKVSLGGAFDEMMIRGCDRSYLGSQPGDIIRALRQVGTLIPVMLLDEIDKIGQRGTSGDVAAALLEMLDSDRSEFKDHYLGLPIDLSGVLFIATANIEQNISPVLRDRLKIIEIDGYTVDEKLSIARDFVLPEEEKRHGLEEGLVQIDNDTMLEIIQSYANEPGVRDIQQHMQAICGKVAYWVVSGQVQQKVNVNRAMVTAILGRAAKKHNLLSSRPEIGVVNALAYIREGFGNVLPIEVGVLPGTGRIQYTGNLRKIIRETCEVVVSLIRSRSSQWNLDPNFHENKDIHFHALEASVPKEGSSIGVTLFTALFSALAGIPVPNDLAMTGEITLRGKIMPIGGLEEKLTAAYNSGIRRVVIPEANIYDLP
ncbi:MAG: S16 family serine protease, partial [Syntrophomonas sp.]